MYISLLQKNSKTVWNKRNTNSSSVSRRSSSKESSMLLEHSSSSLPEARKVERWKELTYYISQTPLPTSQSVNLDIPKNHSIPSCSDLHYYWIIVIFVINYHFYKWRVIDPSTLIPRWKHSLNTCLDGDQISWFHINSSSTRTLRFLGKEADLSFCLE